METITSEPRGAIDPLVAAVSDDPAARLLLRAGADGHATVVAASDLARAVLHAAPAEIEGRTATELMPSIQRVLEAALAEMLTNPASAQQRRFRAPDAQVDGLVVEWTVSTLPHVGDDVVLVELATSDADAAAPAEQRVERAGGEPSLFDEATGLPGRRLFLDRVNHALTRTRRSRGVVALLLVRLENPDVPDDSNPAATGERTRAALGRIVERYIRPSDSVARLDRNELAILLEDLNDPADAELPGRRIAEALRQPIRLDTDLVRLSVSMGVATDTGLAASPVRLLREAGSALDEASAAGDGRLCVFDVRTRNATNARPDLSDDLVDRVAAHRIEAYYQHVVAVPERQPVAVEALMRWHHQQAGTLAAREFVPAAIENGAIHALGERLRSEALSAISPWLSEDPVRYLSINVSRNEILSTAFRAGLEEAVATAHVEPSQLALELSETTYLKSADTMAGVLEELRRGGFPLVIDGYGDGYTSHHHLEEAPVDAIKISGRLTAGIGRSPKGERVLISILSLMSFLGLPVIATGIETREQLAFFEAHGCNFAQGYLLSPPVPAEGLKEARASIAARTFSRDWLPEVSLSPTELRLP